MKFLKSLSALSLVLLLQSMMAWKSAPAVEDEETWADYPASIPVATLREYRDPATGNLHPVTTGHLHALGEPLPSHVCDLKDFRKHSPKQTTLAAAKHILQCAKSQPNLDDSTGILSMMKRMPVSRETLEVAAVWGETHCDSWKRCNEHVQKFRAGIYDKTKFGMDNYSGFKQFRMYRLMNGVLYDDWPFGPLNRTDKSDGSFQSNSIPRNLALFEFLSAKISNLPDIVFFMGTEQAFIPWNLPVPAFGPVAREEYGNMPWPWHEAYQGAYEIYYNIIDAKKDLQDESVIANITDQLPWDQRIPKAAYFGSWNNIRGFAFDAAVAAPDLFDVSFHMSGQDSVTPLNPVSKEGPVSKEDWDAFQAHKVVDEKGQELKTPPHYDARIPGSAWPMMRFSDGRSYKPGHYRYVIVMMAMNGMATSGRTAELLAHSGAVLLLQERHMKSHFSAHLKPWIHYVPISYSGADLVRKVNWLRSHDREAQQIAANARIFARSHLRLEDYYCYALHAIEAVASVLAPDAKIPFNARNRSNSEC